jgi:microcystin-dependent protein
MSDPFIGEIKMFAGTFAPRSYALCDGQLLAISQNDALFSLLGTTYGGDGRTTFGLPDMRGRIPVHQGTGPGLSPRPIGQKSGAETVTLNSNQMPNHGHGIMKGSTDTATAKPAGGNVFAATVSSDIYRDDEINVPLAADAVSQKGSSQSHSNLMPFLCVNFIIALFGVYPSRN